ncbi:hypothetical protein ES703_69657 [subsurface metagenome]
MRERKTGRRLDRRYQRAQKRWTPEELEYLGTKYGLISDKAVCLHLQRSPNAIRIVALRKLHSNRKMNFYTATQLAKVLGIPCSKRLIPWVEVSWLKARRSVVRAGEYRAWLFRDRNIIEFLHSKPWLFNPKKMPEHYFRSIVRAEYERDPWYTCLEAAPLLGVTTDDAVQRYIFHGWLEAEKKPGGPWQGVWIIRRSAIEKFLANDPRPRHRFELASASRKRTWRRAGNPLRLSIIWSVLCPDCGETVVVKADPSLKGPWVQQIFTEIYTNGTCSHGLICNLTSKSYQLNETIGEVSTE